MVTREGVRVYTIAHIVDNRANVNSLITVDKRAKIRTHSTTDAFAIRRTHSTTDAFGIHRTHSTTDAFGIRRTHSTTDAFGIRRTHSTTDAFGIRRTLRFPCRRLSAPSSDTPCTTHLAGHMAHLSPRLSRSLSILYDSTISVGLDPVLQSDSFQHTHSVLTLRATSAFFPRPIPTIIPTTLKQISRACRTARVWCRLRCRVWRRWLYTKMKRAAHVMSDPGISGKTTTRRPGSCHDVWPLERWLRNA